MTEKPGSNYRYIVVEGNIGAGKTTLTEAYCRHLNAKEIYEQFVDNPFLPLFYENPDKYAFQLELSFLVERFRQLKEELESSLFHDAIVADYYLKKSLIFASTTLDEADFKLYARIFHSMTSTLPEPDIVIYLHQNPEQLLQNIARRGRTYESNISNTYLEQIQKSYFRFFKQVSAFPVVVVDCQNIDFVADKAYLNKLLDIPFQRFNKGFNVYDLN